MKPWSPRRTHSLAVAAAVLLAAASSHGGSPLERHPCSLPAIVENLRGAMQDGSPALRNYMKTLLKEAALRLPIEELRAAFAAERDPQVLEALGVALATRASNVGVPSVIEPILDRARDDRDPALRAAALRGLRGTGSVELMEKARGATYADYIRDPSPEVRLAAVDNLIHEDAEVYFGHEGPVADAAVRAAAASQDPALAAKLLADVSMEQAGADSVTALIQELADEDAALRAGAARALGGVGGAHATAANRALVERYRNEQSGEVRAAILEGLVQLGLAASRPTLETLRAVDPSMAPEIDAWLQVLAMNLQEWSIIRREKQRLRP